MQPLAVALCLGVTPNGYDYGNKVFHPLLYEPLQLIHVDLHLQYSLEIIVFLFIWWISQSMAVPIARIHLTLMNLATRAMVLLKSTLATLKHSFLLIVPYT